MVKCLLSATILVKAVILAGGLGTRLSEETHLKPKPMVEIGGRPILWHILKYYSSYGINDFIICCGYKGYLIKEYFINYRFHVSDLQINFLNNQVRVASACQEPWNITLIDTGEETHTGGRLLKVAHLLPDNQPFHMTYGDGLSNVNLHHLTEFHNTHSKLATVTSVQPPGRFGSLTVIDSMVTTFNEKPPGDGVTLNGGFFILQPEALTYLHNLDQPWENEPLQGLTNDRQLMAFSHSGFWHPMDTLRDKKQLESLWKAGTAPWKIW